MYHERLQTLQIGKVWQWDFEHLMVFGHLLFHTRQFSFFLRSASQNQRQILTGVALELFLPLLPPFWQKCMVSRLQYTSSWTGCRVHFRKRISLLIAMATAGILFQAQGRSSSQSHSSDCQSPGVCRILHRL